MSRILIVYGTTDGQTARIASAVAATLKGHGCQVAVYSGAAAGTTIRPETYDGVIVAASVHMGGYQRSVKRWVTANHDALNRMPTMFLSVCLAVLQPEPEPQAEIRRIMERFLAECGWKPTIREFVAGALLYTRYGWIRGLLMRRIARKAGGGTDVTRDYVYTDWDALRAAARRFAGLVAPSDPEARRWEALIGAPW